MTSSLEMLSQALKLVGDFVRLDAPFNKEKQASIRIDTPELSNLKFAVIYEAVKEDTFYGKITVNGGWKLLEAAFFDWERELLSREVYLWDNVWAGHNDRCKAMLAMKDFFGELP